MTILFKDEFRRKKEIQQYGNPIQVSVVAKTTPFLEEPGYNAEGEVEIYPGTCTLGI